MNRNEFVQQFKIRAANEPSVLTLAGTGLNGAAQVAILCDISLAVLEKLKRVNVVSGSSFSYFILQAYHTGGLREDRFPQFDQLNRALHGGGILRAIARLGPVILRKGAFFQNDLLGQTGKHLFTEEFCNRKLSSFPSNLCFWSYCQNTNALIEISTNNGFGSMTVTDLIRATASAKFLHGRFECAGHHFLDPNFSPKASALIKHFFTIRENHLVVNFKRSSSRGRTLLLKQDNSTHPSISIMRDFIFFTLGIPNPYINNTHIDALAILGG
ncbi:MAG: hypothetical protein RL497_2989 [Pseudomonadota bacterium]|jgi:hypothetical protein